MDTQLLERLDAALPQTQCTRCGYPDCRSYAQAMAQGQAAINRCPPGGAEGVVRLAAITGQAPLALDPAHGVQGPRRLAVIDEAWCIGCTLCIKACPVDCIVGASKHMHTVIESQCTGCELCLPACPVDCISLQPLPDETQPERTGWSAWSDQLAQQALERYRATTERRKRPNAAAPEAKAQAVAKAASPQPAADLRHAAIAAALARARDRGRP